MSYNNQKLELTWNNKNKKELLEPRILLEVKELSNNGVNSDNIIIHGDNLLALKALEKQYSGQVKCVYIDPPYNTGNAFEHYDDNVEHSIWLSLMRERLIILRKLLSDSGVIFCQIDDVEQAYLKVMMDEIFGRANFVNIITVKTKIGGVSGSSEGKSLKDVTEFINVFAKDKTKLLLNPVFNYTEVGKYVENYKKEGKSWKYTTVVKKIGGKQLIKEDGEFKFYGYSDFETVSVSKLSKDLKKDESEVYKLYADKIFRTTNAQSSIRQRVMDATKNSGYEVVSVEYIPFKGKNKDKLTEVLYKGDKCNMFMFLTDMLDEIDGVTYYKDKVSTLWDDIQYNNLAKEGAVDFPKGKKPEVLLKRVFDLATEEGDLILDSFLGSGSTAAVAHKMNRKYIGIEMGEQAFSHCKPRLDNIIVNNDTTGISEIVKWQGGGGYKFYKLAPTLIKTDAFGVEIINPEYKPEQLAAAVAIHEGFKYNPSKELFWKQSASSLNSFLYVTTSHVSINLLDSIKSNLEENEHLLISCKSYDQTCESFDKKIKMKKIPGSLLQSCEYGRDDYSFNIIENDEWEEDDE